MDRLEDHDAAWWYAQCVNYKKELDELNPRLDAAVKKNADDAAAHQEYCRVKEELHAKNLAEQGDANARYVNDLVDELKGKHAAAIAELKQKFLIPAQRDLHARQMADIKAQHEAELKALNG